MLLGPLGLRLYYDRRIRNSTPREITEAKKKAKILHSTGITGIKPWTNNNINPFNDEFMKYILLANPDFTKEEIQGLKKLVSDHPELYKMAIVIVGFVPEKIQTLARRLIL